MISDSVEVPYPPVVIGGSQRVNVSLYNNEFASPVDTGSLDASLLLILRDPRGASANACNLDGGIPTVHVYAPVKHTQLLSFKPLALAEGSKTFASWQSSQSRALDTNLT